MRAQPGAEQRPEAFHRIDVDFVDTVAVCVAGVFSLAVVHGEMVVSPVCESDDVPPPVESGIGGSEGF